MHPEYPLTSPPPTIERPGALYAEISRERRAHADVVARKSAVVVNPARVDGIDDLRRTVNGALRAAGWPAATWYETTVDDPGTGQAALAVEEGAEVVFVSGGDGTVRAAVAGLVGTDAALAILPAGTGNLLAVNLGLPTDPAEGVRLVVQGARRKVDVGVVDGEVFAVMAGMGFGASLTDGASTSLKAKVGPLAYVIAAAKHLRDKPMNVSISVDGGPAVKQSARAVLVANVGRLQGGIRLLPDAEPDNGQMEIAVLAPRTIGHWATLAWGILLRRNKIARMKVVRGSQVRVTSDQDQPRDLDGDAIAPGRSLHVTVRPAALWVCVEPT